MRYKFSVIVAIYNVELYIDAFLRSLDAQRFPISDIEIVGVDDGSTDRSGQMFSSWAKGRPNVTLLTQENQGAAAARARALNHVHGEWITVADPDDILDDNYFSAVSDFIQRDTKESASLLATRVYILNDASGEFRDTHPLGKKFRYGDRLARLNVEPHSFQLGATAFFRLRRLREHGLTYNGDIKPTFEDAHLIGRYLATFDDPVVGLVAKAHYYYRKRTAQNSLVQSSWGTVDRFLNTPRLGYLDMLRSVALGGRAPVWAQYMVLYDLLWFFKEDQNMLSKVAWIDEPTRAEFLSIVDDIMRYIDSATIAEFSCNSHSWVLRESLRLKYGSSPMSRVALYKWKRDEENSIKFSLLYSGPRPDLRVYADGALVSQVHSDYTAHRFFGEVYLVEESFSVAGDEISVFANGRALRPRRFSHPSWPRPDTSSAPKLAPVAPVSKSRGNRRLSQIAKRIEVDSLTTRRSKARVVGSKAVTRAIRTVFHKPRSAARVDRAKRIVEVARGPQAAERYGRAWLVMDRPDKADDNGEHFYRFLSKNHPEMNAYFVLSRSSPDWERLKSEGFKMLEYGSRELFAATLNSDVRISSDATADVMYPAPREYFGSPPGKFVFLQHGVTKDDLSRWLNPKPIDLVTTATHDEYKSFVGEESYYKLRRGNVSLTGFARYDELIRLSRNSSKSSILVMPTWRANVRDLLQDVPDIDRQAAFEATEYGNHWLSFLRSKELQELASSYELDIRVIIHPSLDRLVPNLQLPKGVVRADMRSTSFQQLVTEAAVFVTDYSSLAFDAAYINTPSVYYQFDRSSFFAGSHNYRQGYYDYDRDGFGPVCETQSEAIGGLERMLAGGSDARKYERRARKTFRWQDESNCERIFEAINSLF